MGIAVNWSTGYPSGGIDDTVTNFPVLTDNIHDVLVSHVNSLAAAVIQLQNGLGASGGLRVTELDASPSVTPVTTIYFPNGSVTDLGGGAVELDLTVGTPDAGNVSFDPTGTTLAGVTVEAALQELDAKAEGGFRHVVTASDFGTPVYIAGSATSESVTDVTCGTLAATNFPRDSIFFIDIDTPVAGTIVKFPITIPSALPQDFRINFLAFTGGAPSHQYDYVLSAINASNDALNLTIQMNPVSATAYQLFVTGTNGGPPTVSWQTDSQTFTNFVEGFWEVLTVQPFAAAPQFESTFCAIAKDYEVTRRFVGASPSAGDLSTGFPGVTLDEFSVLFSFPSGHTGSATILGYIDFVKTSKEF